MSGAAKHALKVQGADRQKPDPEISPYYWQNAQGIWLHWRMFAPPFATPSSIKGLIVILHGLGEHHARYEGLSKFFNQNGYLVYMLEHQGHGASEGERKYVEDFEHYIQDQEAFIRSVVLPNEWVQKVEMAQGRIPKFLFGHAMGGLMATLLSLKMKDVVNGLVLDAPLLGLDEKTATPLKRSLAARLSKWSPKKGVGLVEPANVAYNELVVTQYRQDPLLCVDVPVTSRLGHNLMIMTDKVQSTKVTKAFTLPVSIHHGEDDIICSPVGSLQFFKKIATPKNQKHLHMYQNCKHEILNEVKDKRTKVRADMIGFMDRLVAEAKGDKPGTTPSAANAAASSAKAQGSKASTSTKPVSARRMLKSWRSKL